MQRYIGGRRAGFTLVELMIVIIILGVLAAVVMVLIGSQTAQAKEVALAGELRSLRHQIMTYQLHHNGELPSPADITQVLTNKTDELGQVATSGRFGPYLTRFPSNPFNGKSDVKAIPAGAELTPDDSSGWLYIIQQDGRFQIAANSSAHDRSGRSLITY